MEISNYLKNIFTKNIKRYNTGKIKLQKRNKLSDELKNEIEKIDWKKFETAYGNAQKTIPKYLKELYNCDEKISLKASHNLWSSLCHQHAYISSASIPAYNILKKRLIDGDENLQIELLDIFYGFTVCSLTEQYEDCEIDFINQMKEKLLNDEQLFVQFTQNKNDEIRYFAESIVKEINNNKNCSQQRV